MVQNDSEHPILVTFTPFPIFSLPKWYKIIQNNQYWSFCTFSNLFQPKWFNLIWNAQFWLFCTLTNLFPVKWSINHSEHANFGHFAHFSQSFPSKVVQNDLECPILFISHLLQYFSTNVVQNDSEDPIWSFHTFSNLFLPKGSKMIWNA